MVLDLSNENGTNQKTIRDNINKEKMKVWKIGTWNVKSINGKENELTQEFEEMGLDILAISETKKKGTGLKELDNGHLLIYSGVEHNTRAAGGVGCLIHHKFYQRVNKWEAISERILTVEINNPDGKIMTFICVYGPNEDEKAEVKDKFWEELTAVTEGSKGTIYVLGDFNSRVGKRDNMYKRILGPYGEEHRNNNGKRMLEYCLLNNLLITNSFHQHKDIHKYTREEPSRGEKSIIDYVLVEAENRKQIIDTRVRRGPEINSDHYLVVTSLKKRMEIDNNANTEKAIHYETIRSYKLTNEKIKKKFEEMVNNEMGKIMANMEEYSAERLWNDFKDVIIESAKKVCGTCKITNNKRQTAWWNEEIRQQVRLKKRKWKFYLKKKTKESYDDYKEQRTLVKNLITTAKEKAWIDFGEKLEQDSKSNQKLFYKALKNLRKEKAVQTTTIKDSQGKILTNGGEIMNRWKQYFQDLLAGEDMGEEFTEMNRQETPEREEEEGIRMEELVQALRKLKNGKSPGQDKITSEMLKNMGENGRTTLLKILNKAWKEEDCPKDWEVGMILPIFKKGDQKNCNNYRGIVLLSTGRKIYEHILNEKLKNIIEPTLIESQSGFRKGRSVQDHIFTIKQIIDKTKMKRGTAYMAFIDLEKAFDKVPRTLVWEILENKGVDKKLNKVIQSLYKNTINLVIYKNMKSKVFRTKEGLRQGAAMSPTLFTVFIDKIIRECNRRTKNLFIGYKNLIPVELSECAYADDVVIMAPTERDLQNNLNVWKEILEDDGMTMNLNKTKVMAIAEKKVTTNIHINGVKVQQVEDFEYLGVTIDETGKLEKEIGKRIENAMKVYHCLNRNFINKRVVSVKTKMNVYQAIYKPILTYGCETWTLTTQQKSRIQATEMKYLRRVKGVTKMDRIRNEKIRQDLGTNPILEFIEQRQLSWWGHMQRMSNNRQVKRIWEARTPTRRKRGRPRETWDGTIGKILAKKGKTWNEAIAIAKEKKLWRQFVYH